MKKISIIIVLLILTGCGTSSNVVTNKPKETIEQIDTARDASVKQEVLNMLQTAEMNYISNYESFNNNCIDVSKLNNKYTGKICMKNNDFYAINVSQENYVCNGTKTTMECIKNDQ